ncbi:1-phosphofructokinase [Viridibacillus sp. FSL H7-0596]|uniref:1-phosphofructokinase n=1 Tax=Viridibacillus sp. FSL H7-0596 TaxID=1928923 RepID=UPI00096EF032|nr:1-phosphofructokinase [Viridibacillus sp. FSL H7-0596]OMC85810.1 1-phosphofructokinase [Viridibacillus sp. FSL H7-0596]
MITTITLNAAIDQVYEVDSLAVGGTNRVSTIIQEAGGKGINVAKVLKRSGADVTVGGFAGGINGERIRQLLLKKSIPSELIQVEGESRVCLTVLDSKKSKVTELLESGPEITKQEWQAMLNWIDEQSKSVKWFALSGSLPKGLPTTAYTELIDIINANGAKAILDSSGDALRNGIKAKPFAIKPNEFEIATILGKATVNETDLLDVGKRFVDDGVEHVCFSLGEKGAIFVNKDGYFKADAPKVEVVNTVGSGDAFVGGLLYGLANGEEPLEAYKRALACGSVNAMYSKIGYIDSQQVEELMGQITIIKL